MGDNVDAAKPLPGEKQSDRTPPPSPTQLSPTSKCISPIPHRLPIPAMTSPPAYAESIPDMREIYKTMMQQMQQYGAFRPIWLDQKALVERQLLLQEKEMQIFQQQKQQALLHSQLQTHPQYEHNLINSNKQSVEQNNSKPRSRIRSFAIDDILRGNETERIEDGKLALC